MNCMISSVESGGPIKLPFYLFDVMWSSTMKCLVKHFTIYQRKNGLKFKYKKKTFQFNYTTPKNYVGRKARGV